jgi:DNA-directed RNA polymerase subunit M/transcription elongation factor TFIIS
MSFGQCLAECDRHRRRYLETFIANVAPRVSLAFTLELEDHLMNHLFDLTMLRNILTKKSDTWTLNNRRRILGILCRLVSDTQMWRFYGARLRTFAYNICRSSEIHQRIADNTLTIDWLMTASHVQLWPQRWVGVELPNHLQREITMSTAATASATQTTTTQPSPVTSPITSSITPAIVEEIGNGEFTTDQFKCGKCGQRKCTYTLAQTRRADEGMTQFIRCMVCNNRWKMG